MCFLISNCLALSESHRIALDSYSILSTRNPGTHSKATRPDHRKTEAKLVTHEWKNQCECNLEGKLSGWSKPRNRSSGHPMVGKFFKPDGFSGSQSIASARSYACPVNTINRQCRCLASLATDRLKSCPEQQCFVGWGNYDSSRQLTQYRPDKTCVNSETIAIPTVASKYKRFLNNSGECLIADIFSTPRPGPSNLLDGLIGPQFRPAD